MPALLFLALPFGVLFGALVLFALARTTSAWTGSASSAQSGGFIGAIQYIFNNSLGSLIVTKTHKIVSSTVSHWAAAHVKPVTRWFLHLNVLTHGSYKTQADFADTTATAFARMRSVVIPREVKSLTGPIGKTAAAANRHANTALAREKALSSSVATTHRAQVRLNHHYTHALDVTLPGQLGRIRTREDTLSRDVNALKNRAKALEDGALDTFKWIKAHPLSLATGVFAGAVAVALTHMGFGFLRCRSWKRVGRSLTCGMGAALAAVLEAGLALLVVVDPVAIAKTAIITEDGIDYLVRQIVGAAAPSSPAPPAGPVGPVGP